MGEIVIKVPEGVEKEDNREIQIRRLKLKELVEKTFGVLTADEELDERLEEEWYEQ